VRDIDHRRRGRAGRLNHAPITLCQDRRDRWNRKGFARRAAGLFLAGVDTFRLKFGHGTYQDLAAVHAAIRALERDIGGPLVAKIKTSSQRIAWADITPEKLCGERVPQWDRQGHCIRV
jgi:hypothetical protein